MGREIRKVPKNWKHPKKNKYSDNKNFTPLHDNYVGSLKYFKEEVDDFIKHMTEIIEKGKVKVYDKTWEDPRQLFKYLTEDGEMSPPDIKDYMPSGNWFQLFETVTEGTPLSPPFKTKRELVEWLSNNKDFWDRQWTREQAEAMVKQGYTPSMIFTKGKLYDSQESLLIDK